MWTILTAGIGWLFRCSVNGWSNVPFCWSPGKLFFGGGGGWFPPTLANGKGQHELTKVCRCTQHPVWHTEWSFEAFCTEDQSTTHNRVLARYLPAAIRGRPQNWIERDEKLNERGPWAETTLNKYFWRHPTMMINSQTLSRLSDEIFIGESFDCESVLSACCLRERLLSFQWILQRVSTGESCTLTRAQNLTHDACYSLC